MTRGPDPIAPLWRAAQAFRLLSCLYALGFQTAINSDLRHPATAWVLFSVLMAWSAACAVAYLRGFGRRPAWVIAEIIVVVLLMWSNKVVASPQWAADNQTWPTTLWASNPTISAALQFGPVGGMLTGLVVMATNFAVKNYLTLNLGHNATIIIELSIGLAIGMAARTARHAHDELQRAAQLSAAVEERERLSRQVHDGVIQVLALVAKRGHEIGGATSDLADLASEQERALRRWLSSATLDDDVEQDSETAVDLRALLRRRESDRVSMSLPGTAVTLERRVAAELDAAVGNALDNVARTRVRTRKPSCCWRTWAIRLWSACATTASAFRRGGSKRRPVRDVWASRSRFVGRLASLGGTAQLRTDVGEGTEWELCVPRQNGKHG